MSETSFRYNHNKFSLDITSGKVKEKQTYQKAKIQLHACNHQRVVGNVSINQYRMFFDPSQIM